MTFFPSLFIVKRSRIGLPGSLHVPSAGVFTCSATLPPVRGWKVHSRASSSRAKTCRRMAIMSGPLSWFHSTASRSQALFKVSSSASQSWLPFTTRCRSFLMTTLKLPIRSLRAQKPLSFFGLDPGSFEASSNTFTPKDFAFKLARASSTTCCRKAGGARRHTFTTLTDRSNACFSAAGHWPSNSSRTQRPTKTPGIAQGWPGTTEISCSTMSSKSSGGGASPLALDAFTVTFKVCAAAFSLPATPARLPTRPPAAATSGPSKTSLAGSRRLEGVMRAARASAAGCAKNSSSPSPPSPS
mmetsp:Transcript_158586/g.508768  ORF Transcript_158586/g.508768 Transcript_158586/m.508768 type:complete len:299 (+) Transcript_158586:811-1707(+)